jgi:hypothetical protein
MAARTNSLGDELDQLYTQPLASFVAARDALARKLRDEGDRAGAQLVKGLRKPSPAAWALNQLCVRHSTRLQQLLEAGERMREAQRELIASGEREPLREAAARERELVEELAALAEHELTAAGHTVSAALRTQLFETLHAAVGDAEVREQLGTGRLVRDHRLSDLGLPEAPPSADAGGRREADRRAKALRSELQQARARQSEAQRLADEAQRVAAAAQREAELAAEDAARALALAADAAARVSELQEALGELQLR